MLDLLADERQRLAKRQHPAILCLVAHVAPTWVVPILLASLGIVPCSLQMPLGHGADPDLGPGGRDAQGLDPSERLWITGRSAMHIEVGKALPGALTSHAGSRVSDVAQPSCLRRHLGSCEKNCAWLASHALLLCYSCTRHPHTEER